MRDKQELLRSKLASKLNHPTTQGDHWEQSWINFFRDFLPSKYALDKGFVFDSKGHFSEQIDIIIYDALYAPLVYETEGEEKYVTAESVYAILESKSEINKENLEYANEKIKSVTSLYRTSRSVINAGSKQAPRELTHILSGILAVNSIGVESVKEYCIDCNQIDLGCAAQKNDISCEARDQSRTHIFHIEL